MLGSSPSLRMNATPAAERRGFLLASLFVLAVAMVLRLWLIGGGGQFGQIDEARYLVSRDAAHLWVHGENPRAGIARALAGGDHVGFKLLGIVPAVVEEYAGRDDRIPAWFFGGFSVLNIALAGLIVHRLTRSPRAAFWAVLTAATCTAWFYFSRHLLPYDAALFFMLLALLFGLRLGAVPIAGFMAGLSAGCGFVVYYGYWNLGAVMLVLGALWRVSDLSGRSLLRGVIWSVCALLGLALAICLPIAADAAWGGGTLVAGARALSGTIGVGDFRGHIAPWEYLWHTDKLWLVAALAATVTLTFTLRRGNARGRAIVFLISGLLMVWLFLFVTSTVLHVFGLHDRMLRQVTPFLVALLALGLDQWTSRANGVWTTRIRTAVALGFLVGNAVFCMVTPLALEFPRDFKARGDALLARRNDTPDRDSYVRYVNVTHYFMEPEVLRDEPIEVLLVAKHPHQYVPYLYEAQSPEARAYRRSIDHRMRLVRMAVTPAERIRGDDYGQVRLSLRFPVGRSGFADPLLSVGSVDRGELFFVRYLQEGVIALGVEIAGIGVFESEPLPIDPAAIHDVVLFTSSLLPPAGAAPQDPAIAAQQSAARGRVEIQLNGASVVSRRAPPMAALPDQVHAGVNVVRGGRASTRFGGDIFSVSRGGMPPLEKPLGLPEGYGMLELTLRLRTLHGNVAEPLVVLGEAGRAVFVFVRPVGLRQVRLGVEVWGVGAWETEPLPTQAPERDIVTVSLPAFYPAADNAAAWRGVPAERRDRALSHLVVQWNGQTVLVQGTALSTMDPNSLSVGENRIGGSVVSDRFTGEVESIRHFPLTASVERVP